MQTEEAGITETFPNEKAGVMIDTIRQIAASSDMSNPESVADTYLTLKLIAKAAEAISKEYQEVIGQYLDDGELLELPDGRHIDRSSYVRVSYDTKSMLKDPVVGKAMEQYRKETTITRIFLTRGPEDVQE